MIYGFGFSKAYITKRDLLPTGSEKLSRAQAARSGEAGPSQLCFTGEKWRDLALEKSRGFLISPTKTHC